MISKNNFFKILTYAEKQTYSSFKHLNYDKCKHSTILNIDTNIILLIDKTKKPAMIYYSTNDYSLLINKLKSIKESVQINFVEHKFKTELENIGFTTLAEFIDFFCDDINNILIENGQYGEIIFSNIDECDKLSILSKKCSNLSRGFNGEIPEWFTEWMTDNNVIIINDTEKNILAYCCVAIYSNGTILWIREMAVDPIYQNKGIGKKLVEQAICYGRNKGAKKAFLAVDIKNERAINIYKKYNFINKENIGELQMIKL
jgi:hypothetical protein